LQGLKVYQVFPSGYMSIAVYVIQDWEEPPESEYVQIFLEGPFNLTHDDYRSAAGPATEAAGTTALQITDKMSAGPTFSPPHLGDEIHLANASTTALDQNTQHDHEQDASGDPDEHDVIHISSLLSLSE
jgi:hypothetical protein